RTLDSRPQSWSSVIISIPWPGSPQSLLLDEVGEGRLGQVFRGESRSGVKGQFAEYPGRLFPGPLPVQGEGLVDQQDTSGLAVGLVRQALPYQLQLGLVVVREQGKVLPGGRELRGLLDHLLQDGHLPGLVLPPFEHDVELVRPRLEVARLLPPQA